MCRGLVAASLLFALACPAVGQDLIEPAFLSRPLPGAAAPDTELRRQLAERWRSRPPDYRPRTRHLDAEGNPEYTNRLFLSASPYLRQHAHNPVNWYPWGDEAFAAAAQLGRPVLLSVGYSTCHWCHVMEEESFEDEEIARFLNEHYVAIKVDREERPDVDAIYMSAVQALTGGGGWPMTVWLTPDRQPFFAGTYFPPRDGERGSRFGFLTLLRNLDETYRRQPEEVAQRAAALTAEVRNRLGGLPAADALPGASILRAAFAQYAARFDTANGGIRGAPKFPSSLPTRFLLRFFRRDGDPRALEMAVRTLANMSAGGLYDQVGGGFHRYSTDARWLVPHFEKMLYDNALLTVAYLEAYQATKNEDFARVAREVLRYVERDMTSADGAFYSASDADSPTAEGRREEGWFFTWTPAEIDAALTAEQARVVKAYFAVTDSGNFAGRNILHTPRELDQVAAELHLDPVRMRDSLDAARARLYEARAQRPPPLRDEKVLAAWNGLMVSAFARAAMVLDEPRYAVVAARAADFVLKRMRPDGRLRRSFKEGRAWHAAYLDDYAFVIASLLDLYEVSQQPRWLRDAIALDRVVAAEFEDQTAGGFFMTGSGHEELLAREKPAYDGAEPSGNSVEALNLLRLYEWSGDDTYRARAERALRAFGRVLEGSPTALSEMLLAVDFHSDRVKEIVIVAASSQSDAEPFVDRLRAMFLPNRVLAVATEAELNGDRGALVPLLRDKVARGGKTTAYVCERQVCALPTTDPAVFANQLQPVVPLADASPSAQTQSLQSTADRPQ